MILDLLNIDQATSDIDKLVAKYKDLNLEQSIAQMTADGVAEAEMKAVLSSQNYGKAEIEEAIATNASNIAKGENIALTKAQTVAHKVGTVAIKAFNIALTTAARAVAFLLATKFIEWIANVVQKNRELNRTMEESIEVFETLGSEIESINKELETTKDRIDELNGKENLSFTEQEELERLKEQNAELDRELKYKQALQDIEKEKLTEDARGYFKTRSTNTPDSDEHNYSGDYLKHLNYVAGNTSEDTSSFAGEKNVIDEAKERLTSLQDLENQIEERKNTIQDLETKTEDDYAYKSVWNQSRQQLAQAKKEKDQFEKEYKDLYEQSLKDRLDIGNYSNYLDPDTDKNVLEQAKSYFEFADEFLGTGKSSTEKFNELWNSLNFKDERRELEELAKAGKLDEDVISSNKEYKELIDSTGKTAKEVAEHINSMVDSTEDVDVPFTKSEMISAINGLSEGFESLDKIMASQKDEDPFDYALLDDKNFKDNFSGLGEAYEDFVERISNSPKDVNACQAAYNNLVTEWIDGKGILKEVTESTAKVTEAMLKNMGVANASELVAQALEYQAYKTANAEEIQKGKTNALALEQLYATETGYDLISSSWGVIEAFANEQNASEFTIQALAELKLAQLDLADNPIDLSTNISQILTMAQAAKVGAKYIAMLKEMEYWQDMEGSYATDRFNYLANQLNSTNGEWAQSVEVEFKPVEYNGLNYTGGTKTNDSGSSKDPKKEEIDWIERKKEILQRLHDVQEEIANDENESYKERVDALNYLIEKDKERVEAAKNAVSQYEKAWKDASANLTDEDKKFIEQGGDIVKKYNAQELVDAGIVDSLDAGEEYIENLKSAQDWYDKMIESQKEELAHQKESIEHQKQKIQLLRDQIVAQQDLNNAETEQINSRKELAEIQGKYIGQDYYEDLIRQSKEQESLIKQQIDTLYDELELTEEESAERDNVLVEIENCKNELIQCEVEQAELNDTIMRLPIERLQMFRDLYAQIIEDMDNYRSIQDKMGLNPTKEELQTYIDLYSESIESTIEQQNKLKDLLDNYSYGSEKYNETMEEIQGLDNEISNLIASQIELNHEMLQIPITEMSEEIDKLGTYKEALNNAIAEDNANGLQTTIDQYRDLHSITLQQLGLYAQQKAELTKLLGVYDENSQYYKDTEQQIADIDSQMSSLVQETYNWNAELLNIPIENLEKVNENLSSYSSILDGILSDYDSALQGVNTLIDNEIEGVQDVLDALNQQNEALQIQRNLEQALYNLRRAEEQKTTKVIRDGQVQYESNQDDLRSARQELADAQYDKMVYDLEQQIEALEDIKEKWQDIIDKIQEAKDLQAAENLFGDGWQDSVLADSADLRDMFQNLYEITSKEKEFVDKQIESNERISQMMNEFVTRYQEGSLTYEQALSGISELISSMEGGFSAFEQLNGMMNLDNIANLGEIASSAEASITGSAELLEKYLSIVESNKADVENFETNWGAISEGVKDVVDSFNVAVDSMDGYIDVFNKNAEAINEHTSTWEEMKASIEEQVEALKKAAEALEKAQKEISSNKGSSSYDDDDDDYVSEKPIGVYHHEYGQLYNYGENGTLVDPETGEDLGVSNYTEFMKKYEDELKKNKYHTGIEKGPVGFSPLSNDEIYKFARRVATNPLKADEVVALLQKGELVTQPEQMSNIMRNNQMIGQMAAEQANSAIKSINNVTRDNVIDFSIGEIHLHEVQNVDEFVKALGQTFESSMQQNFSKIFKH